MGDKSVKNRDWSGATGQAARPLPEEAKEALKDIREAKKIKELANKQAARPLPEEAKEALHKRRKKN
jgi:hypothetical protein